MKKLIVLTIMVGVMLGGCIRKGNVFDVNKTPEIILIDKVIASPPGDDWLGPVNRLMDPDMFVPASDSKKIKWQYRYREKQLTKSLRGVSINKIKKWFADVDLPCKEVSEGTIKCNYLIYTYSIEGIDGSVPLGDKRFYSIVTLTFVGFDDNWELAYEDIKLVCKEFLVSCKKSYPKRSELVDEIINRYEKKFNQWSPR